MNIKDLTKLINNKKANAIITLNGLVSLKQKVNNMSIIEKQDNLCIREGNKDILYINKHQIMKIELLDNLIKIKLDQLLEITIEFPET